MAKFFTMIEREGLRTYNTLFVCDDETPIPTAQEIVAKKQWSPYIAQNPVKQISRLRWFVALMADIGRYVFSRFADELYEYSPECESGISFFHWWDGESDYCEG